MTAFGGNFTHSANASERNQEATVFVGGLDEKVTDELLWELMVQAGPVKHVYIPRDRITGQAQGYGFCEFRTEDDAQYAVKIMNMVKLFGKPIKVQPSSEHKRSLDVGANIFIGNLDPDVDEKMLYDTFSAFGSIIETPHIMRDPDTGNSKGYGFVKFNSFEASDAAIESMNGGFIMNRSVVVQYAYKKDGNNKERHGSEAERLLAAKAQAQMRPNSMYNGPMPNGGMNDLWAVAGPQGAASQAYAYGAGYGGPEGSPPPMYGVQAAAPAGVPPPRASGGMPNSGPLGMPPQSNMGAPPPGPPQGPPPMQRALPNIPPPSGQPPAPQGQMMQPPPSRPLGPPPLSGQAAHAQSQAMGYPPQTASQAGVPPSQTMPMMGTNAAQGGQYGQSQAYGMPHGVGMVPGRMGPPNGQMPAAPPAHPPPPPPRVSPPMGPPAGQPPPPGH